jgi:GntR family transcriptional regulator of arabinose operon
MSRSSPRTDEAREQLVDWIVEGRWDPGERLPTHVELLEELQVSRSTLQSALGILKEEGFVRTRRRSGTFVAQHPPHRFHYALAFPGSRERSMQNAFQQRLAEVAAGVNRNEACRLRTYYEINPHADSDDYMQLLEDARQHRVAGLALVMEPDEVRRTRLVKKVDVPVVVIGKVTDVPDVLHVNLDTDHYLEKALDYLSERGRRHIALLTHVGLVEELGAFEQCVEARGMITHPYWMQITALDAATFVANTAHLLMKCEEPERPDGLLIRDDNLVDSAIVGLSAAGVRVGRDLDVVAHANFPVRNESLAPVKRIGYDARQILRQSIQLIQRANASDAPRRVAHVRARMEEEVEPAVMASPAAMM